MTQCQAIITIGPNTGKRCARTSKTGFCYCMGHIGTYGWVKSNTPYTKQ